ncbi:MAG: hypothetical protein KDE55_14070 [Novosphingobium sp.]|nr:hypothetical protein [Novosphingobium sp.]
MTQRTRMLSVALVGAVGLLAWQSRAEPDGCPVYIPADVPLIAHAGGGLPDKTYANNRAALDLAAKHGFTMIEIDFMDIDGRLAIGHDGMPESSLTIDALLQWLDAHPGVSVVTDFKTDNLEGLAMLKRLAGERITRFIPQIYHPDQFEPVTALGYPAPIFTAYRWGDDSWIDWANRLPLRAVTMPKDRKHLAPRIEHRVFLHTVNEPMEGGFGLYTDCLVPSRGGLT